VTTRALAIAGFAVALLAVVLAVVAIVVVRSDNGSGTRVPVPVLTLAPTPATPTPVRVLDGGAVAQFIESDGRYQNVICPDEPVRKGTTYTCTGDRALAPSGSSSVRFTVTITSDSGDYTWAPD
jgi:hypothetical protein